MCVVLRIHFVSQYLSLFIGINGAKSHKDTLKGICRRKKGPVGVS